MTNTPSAKRKLEEDFPLHSVKKRKYTSNVVTLKAGKGDADPITVHQRLLTDNSDFFKAALEKQWRESQSSVIELPDDKFRVVVAYVDYLYAKRTLEVDPWKTGDPDDMHLARLYCFGEKILDNEYCNCVLDTMITACDEAACYPSDRVISHIYAHTPQGSGLRACMVYMFAHKVTSGLVLEEDDPSDFLREVIRKMCEIRETSPEYDPQTEKEKWMKKAT